MHPVWFEPTISAGERPQTYALDRAATRNGNSEYAAAWIYRNTRVLQRIYVVCLGEYPIIQLDTNIKCRDDEQKPMLRESVDKHLVLHSGNLLPTETLND